MSMWELWNLHTHFHYQYKRRKDMKIEILKDHKQYKKGEKRNIFDPRAIDLIDKGIAKEEKVTRAVKSESEKKTNEKEKDK